MCRCNERLKGNNKLKDLSVCESEEHGRRVFGWVYDTLMESGTVETNGRTEGGTRPGRTRKKLKDLSATPPTPDHHSERWRQKGFVIKNFYFILL